MRSAAKLASQAFGAFIFGAALAPAANAATADDACSLRTSAQIAAALGAPVGAGTHVTPTFKQTCTWNATTGDGEIVALSLQGPGQSESGKKFAADGTSASVTPVGGIGDEAYYFGSDKPASLAMKKGGAAFKVAVYARVAVEKQRAAKKALALQVVPQL